MKYNLEIEISLPREKVFELFTSTENIYKWQPSLQSFDHISGNAGEVGAKSKMVHKMGKRTIEMVQTITENNFPHEFSAIYEAKGVWNEVKNYFIEKDNKTIWKTEHEFKCKGFVKVLSILSPKMFRKQSYKYMKDLKKYAEE